MNTFLYQSMRSVPLRRAAPLLHQQTVSSARTLALTATGTGTVFHFPRTYSSLPTVAQPSFWKSLIPKPLRRQPGTSVKPRRQKASDEWNPATFYIFMFLFIGSMAIQNIALKKDFDTSMRQSEAKIGLLREVIERIKKGEDVDVERVLGTGDPEQEAEWEAALKQLERDEAAQNAKRQDKKKAASAPSSSTEPVAADVQTAPTTASKPKVASITSFY